MSTQKNTRVLLREPERCPECGWIFLSLYSIRSCTDHEALDEIFVRKRPEGAPKDG